MDHLQFKLDLDSYYSPSWDIAGYSVYILDSQVPLTAGIMLCAFSMAILQFCALLLRAGDSSVCANLTADHLLLGNFFYCWLTDLPRFVASPPSAMILCVPLNCVVWVIQWT